jgi:hypothetical protein
VYIMFLCNLNVSESVTNGSMFHHTIFLILQTANVLGNRILKYVDKWSDSHGLTI